MSACLQYILNHFPTILDVQYYFKSHITQIFDMGTHMTCPSDVVTVDLVDFFQLYHQVTSGNIMEVMHAKQFNTLLEMRPLIQLQKKDTN